MLKYKETANPCGWNSTKLYCFIQWNLAPPPPPGYCGALHSSAPTRGWGICKFALPRGQASANPGARPELLTRTRFPIRMYLHRGYLYWEKSRLAHLSGTGGCKGMFSIGLRAVSLFSWSVEQNARDTQMTTRLTEGAGRESQRSRVRAPPY